MTAMAEAVETNSGSDVNTTVSSTANVMGYLHDEVFNICISVFMLCYEHLLPLNENRCCQVSCQIHFCSFGQFVSIYIFSG